MAYPLSTTLHVSICVIMVYPFSTTLHV
ncbi:hypothetical protein F383_21735 [Gossypium arboreum]|uniref:Uncharacterized protein n=1 Tax=Gossypium arboreum TaxID=29729 RepID=A0A0B0NUD1_GOSAR|nr:hypothetical protein F383_21735 [Gossypium arboreum]